MYADDGIVLLLCIMNLAPRRWIVAVILGLLAGCSDSPKNTFEGYKARAERGDPVAQFNLGVCYDNGEGVAKDQVEAVKWFRKAADQGLAEAQGNLGVCYRNGKGVAKDQVEAVKWFRKAADQGLAEAQGNLGFCYDNGKGVAKDQVEAVKWFRKAADQGLAVAQFNLGVCYLYGHGVVKDLNVAYAYWSVAGITNENVRNNLARIERQMSAGQIADGKKRAAELQKQIDTRIAAKKPRK